MAALKLTTEQPNWDHILNTASDFTFCAYNRNSQSSYTENLGCE